MYNVTRGLVDSTVRVHIMPNYDDPEIEAQWFAERRTEVAEYLKHEGVTYGQIAEEPAWYISPYVSIWAIESNKSTGKVGWWAISGDMPNDYVLGSSAENPREAMHAIASLWKEAAQCMARGERHPTFVIGTGENDIELASMLSSRAKTLLEWANDPEIWEENEL